MFLVGQFASADFPDTFPIILIFSLLCTHRAENKGARLLARLLLSGLLNNILGGGHAWSANWLKENGSALPVNSYYQRRGFEENDHLLIVFDPSSREAQIQIADESESEVDLSVPPLTTPGAPLP